MFVKYFKQEGKFNCSLAALRMILNTYGVTVSESELYDKVALGYGENFKNIWNSTIAKLAMNYGIKTEVYAIWKLFKKDLLQEAFEQFSKDQNKIDFNKYENKNDTDVTYEPLKLAYTEMLTAIQNGCKTTYGKLTPKRIKNFLQQNFLIQTSVRLHLLYPGKKRVFHSILLYGYENDQVLFHDPYWGPNQKVSFSHLEKAMQNMGVGMIYKGKK